VIVQPPVNQVTKAGSSVLFNCGVETDPYETDALHVQWKRNGVVLDYGNEDQRIKFNRDDKSLSISDVSVADSSTYTCHADNGLDQTQVSATLLIKGLFS